MQRRACFFTVLITGVLLSIAASLFAQGFPYTFTDSLNRAVTIKGKPKRIVSVAPGATEVLFAIGAGPRVVADTTYCKYPAAAARLPKIGGYTNPNVEKIITLKPDLVLGQRGTPRDIWEQMAALKLTVAVVDAEKSVDEMLKSINTIGRLAGEEKNAAALVKKLTARKQAVEQKTAKLAEQQRPRVLFIFSADALFSAGQGSFIDEIITLGGGRNIAAKTKLPWPELSMEMVIAEDPQVILLLPGVMGEKHKPLTSAAALARLRGKPQWKNIAAVKNGRVAVLGDDEMTLPGPRLIDGLETTAKALHPALFGKGAK